MKKLLVLLIASQIANAGLSVNLNPTNNAILGNNSIPSINLATTNFIVEFALEAWGSTPNTQIASLNIANLQINLANSGSSNVRLNIFMNGASQPPGCVLQIQNDTAQVLYVRYQNFPTSSSAGTEYCDAYDPNQNYYTGFSGLGSTTYSGVSFATTSNGACVGGGFCSANGSSFKLAYFRVFTGVSTPTPLNSTPPTTAQSLALNCLVSWKFDAGNNTSSNADSCPSALYPWSILSGTLSSGDYYSTPYQTSLSIPKTGNIPTQDKAWASWVTLQNNTADPLDGTNSYSQADGSPSVTCQWTFISGPMTPSITGANTCTPSITPTIASNTTNNDYIYQLTVTDSNSNTNSTNLEFGVVNYDSNGVVIFSNPDVERISGKMIAFGHNPWGWMDERALTGFGLQKTFLCNSWEICVDQNTYPKWLTKGTGTASYYFSGIGFVGANSAPSATLTGVATAANVGTCTVSSITTSSTYICANVNNLPSIANGQSLPTLIWLGTNSTNAELVRICATTGTSGVQVLTVCYNGRGITGDYYNGGNALPPTSWPVNTLIGEARIDGSSSKFSTDSNVPICPAGVPGPPGNIDTVDTAGTVYFTTVNTTVFGTGTNWSNIPGGYEILIHATHNGGQAFNLFGFFSTSSSTQGTINAVVPSDIDLNTQFSYTITTGNTGFSLVLSFQATAGYQANINQFAQYCESDTVMFFAPAHDIPTFNATHQTSQTYTYQDVFGEGTRNDYGFYGEDLAFYNNYLRSGYAPFLKWARGVTKVWPNDPRVANGWVTSPGFALLWGGAVIGSMQSLVLDSGTPLTTWDQVRPFANLALSGFFLGGFASQACGIDDTRDTSFMGSWLALAAYYDPNSTQKAIWQAGLGPGAPTDSTLYNYERICRKAEVDNGYENAAFKFAANLFPPFSGANVPLKVTKNSLYATAQSGSLSAGMCMGTNYGTNNITVTHNSNIISGASLSGGGLSGWSISMTGTQNSGTSPLTVKTAYYNNGTNWVTAVAWPGDSGSITSWMTENNNVCYSGDDGCNTVIATTGNETINAGVSTYNDPMVAVGWACYYDSGNNRLILDRPWSGTQDYTNSYYPFISQGYSLPGGGQQPYMMGIKSKELRYAALSDGALGTNFAGLEAGVGTWQATIGYNPSVQALDYATSMSTCLPNNPTQTLTPGFSYAQSGCSFSSGNYSTAKSLNNEGMGALSLNVIVNNYSAPSKATLTHAYGSTWGNPIYTASGYYYDATGGYSGLLDNASLSENKWYPFAFGMGMQHEPPAILFQGIVSPTFTTIKGNITVKGGVTIK